MKRFSMAITTTAVLAATAFFAAPANAGGIKVTFGHNNDARATVHSHKKSFSGHKLYAQKHAVCKGYYGTQSYEYWVNGYWDQQWVDTSRWVVDGLTAGGQANYVWVTDGYWDKYWVNGYWATGYQKVWVPCGCHRCRLHH